uniref:ribonuclease H n=1 Tax=Otus sunia TaxID=257818 RepID=A0A8C8B1G9_9STRI
FVIFLIDSGATHSVVTSCKGPLKCPLPFKAKNVTPIKIELKPGVKPVRVNQYAIRLEVQKELETLVNTFMQYRLLRECQSEFNTPILPVRKPHSQKYRLVQDLRAIIQITTDIHPTVPNPYTVLAAVAESNTYFTVLDLKDAFFCIPVDEQSQAIFAFQWESPSRGRNVQMCWMVLPQGFKNSPTLCGNVLAKALKQWQGNNDHVTLLQYVDDLLIGADMEECGRHCLLKYLGLAGYRVSQKRHK